MEITTNRLDFVTIEGLWHTQRNLPDIRPPQMCSRRRPFRPATGRSEPRRPWTPCAALSRTRSGFSRAAAYRSARRAVIQDVCAGDELVFYAAWNRLLAEGGLQSLMRAPIGSVLKPAHRRPVAIVPRAQLTPRLAEGRIVLDLGDDRFWLLPRDLADRTLLFTMRHGISRVESKTHRSVGGWPISSTRNEAFHEPMPSGPPWRGW